MTSTMMSATTPRPRRRIPVLALDDEAFAPYGQVIWPRRAGGQFDDNPYDPEKGAHEAALTLNNGVPRLWLMQLGGPRLLFASLARHRRVSQCLGAMHGREWFIGVSPPSDPGDGARPDVSRLLMFRVPGDCVIKLHVGTWHAGPLFAHDECLFFNLENLDTNKRDFDAVDLADEFEVPAQPASHAP
jgi:ureidoglycolate hydrolase